MNSDTFKAKAYVKAGCPFSLKYLIFMAEAGLLEEIEIIRLDEDEPDFEPTKSRLSEGLGKSATFPTVEIAPDRFMSDSDALIAHYATAKGLDPGAMPVLTFYLQTIFPQLSELHKPK